MRSVSYYAFEEKGMNGLDTGNRASDAYPYMVNCAGFISIAHPFTSYNSRGREDYYLMYINEGHLHMDIKGETVRVGAGDAVIFPPKYKYRYTLSGNGSISYYYTHFTGSHAEMLLNRLGFGELPLVVPVGHSEEALNGFSEMFASFTRDDELRDLSTAVATEQILIALARARRAVAAPMPLERSIAYIKSFYAEQISIPELAAMEGLSVSRYNTLFKAFTGQTPIGYITNLRIDQACSLLMATNLPIKEIGAAVGYSDNHFFSKVFKKKMGVSAQKYREKQAF